jgi:hypothetical protein
MKAILTTIYCLPCIWSVVGLLGIFGTVSYILNTWMPFGGVMPSDGPIDGFASKQARIEFFNDAIHARRIRAATKAGFIGALVWLTVLFTAVIILSRLGGGAA